MAVVITRYIIYKSNMQGNKILKICIQIIRQNLVRLFEK